VRRDASQAVNENRNVADRIGDQQQENCGGDKGISHERDSSRELSIYWLLNKSPASNWFASSEDISPPLLSLPTILFALFVTNLASDVWQKHFQAKEALLHEAAAVRSLIQLSADVESNGQTLMHATTNYIHAVIDREWSAMIHGDHAQKESALRELEALDSTISKIGNGHPQPKQYSALRLNGALESLRLSRLQRISLAHDSISISKWASVMTLGLLALTTIALTHLRRPKAMKISILLTILCILASIHVLSQNRSPYVGVAAVSNVPLIDALNLVRNLKN
jgi:hypothetical protein